MCICLPDRPREIRDDGEFHFAVLGPGAVSDSGKPGAEAKRFIEETTGRDRPRTCRNAVVLAAPSRDGLDAVRACIREYLGWREVRSQIRDLAEDAGREAMLAGWTEQARRRVPEAVRQAWAIVIAVNERNDIQAFKITVGGEPLFATVKADRRARIQDSPISAEAMLPGGPYDLWRADEPSRRVKDLAGAFAENPKLPKMLRHKEILDTIDRGVQDGIFVASLIRPDKSVRTWWRTPIDEAACAEAALELFLPEKATLSELDPNLLAPGALPGLWGGDAVPLAEAVAYFAGGREVAVPREGYEETVAIPACPRAVVEAALSEAVRLGVLWLVNGPASLQGEAVPPGVLTDAAELRAPMPPPHVDALTKEALPDAWRDGQTTALALHTALSVKRGLPLPWPVVRRAIDEALGARWLERAPGSGPWPCDAAGRRPVTLVEPGVPETGPGVGEDGPAASADLEPSQIQDLADVLPEIVQKAADADAPLRLHLRITLGGGASPDLTEALNRLLAGVNDNLRFS